MRKLVPFCLLLSSILACQSAPPPPPAPTRVPIADLAFTAERDLGALGEILETEAYTRQTLTGVNGFWMRSGLAGGLPSAPSVSDATACFHANAAGLGLQIAHIDVTPPVDQPLAPGHLAPGERWNPDAQLLLGAIPMVVDVNGPVPLIARLIDLVGRCPRLVLVQDAKVQGSQVRLKAIAWYERAVPAPEIDLKWRSVDDRLIAAGWKLDDPALATDPALPRLKSAVTAGREQMPAVRALLKTTVELPRYMVRARELLQIRDQVQRVDGRRLLGLPG